MRVGLRRKESMNQDQISNFAAIFGVAALTVSAGILLNASHYARLLFDDEKDVFRQFLATSMVPVCQKNLVTIPLWSGIVSILLGIGLLCVMLPQSK